MRLNSGKGRRVQCDLKVSQRQILYIMVGLLPSLLNGAASNASNIRIGGSCGYCGTSGAGAPVILHFLKIRRRHDKIY